LELVGAGISLRGDAAIDMAGYYVQKMATNNLVVETKDSGKLIKLHPQKSETKKAGPVPRLLCDKCGLVVVQNTGQELDTKLTVWQRRANQGIKFSIIFFFFGLGLILLLAFLKNL